MRTKYNMIHEMFKQQNETLVISVIMSTVYDEYNRIKKGRREDGG